MKNHLANPRAAATEVDAMFLDRWSPRAFREEPLTDAQVAALFEAARWAPSCYNEQPWHFRYARSSEDRERFATALVEKNQIWATRAPLLLFVLTRKHFGHSSRPNRHAAFDAGAAWMALALQARRLGFYAHAMAGFNIDTAYQVLNADRETYDIMAAVAVGFRGEPTMLNEEMAAIEAPNGRKSPTEVAGEGAFSG